MLDSSISLILIGVVSVSVALSGIKRAPGIGIVLAVIFVGISAWLKGGITHIGLTAPDSWIMVLILGFLFGALLSFLSISVIEPAVEQVTGSPHDISIVERIRENVKALLQWLLLVWVVVAFAEEIIFRGFLMSEIVQLVGSGIGGLGFSLLVSSVIFGLAHWYQGPSGTLSTGITGIILGIIFIWSGFNLWLPILTHGFIDTVSLVIIFFNADKFLKQLFWKHETVK